MASSDFITDSCMNSDVTVILRPVSSHSNAENHHALTVTDSVVYTELSDVPSRAGEIKSREERDQVPDRRQRSQECGELISLELFVPP